jgi:hypothetical protein
MTGLQSVILSSSTAATTITTTATTTSSSSGGGSSVGGGGENGYKRADGTVKARVGRRTLKRGEGHKDDERSKKRKIQMVLVMVMRWR